MYRYSNMILNRQGPGIKICREHRTQPVPKLISFTYVGHEQFSQKASRTHMFQIQYPHFEGTMGACVFRDTHGLSYLQSNERLLQTQEQLMIIGFPGTRVLQRLSPHHYSTTWGLHKYYNIQWLSGLCTCVCNKAIPGPLRSIEKSNNTQHATTLRLGYPPKICLAINNTCSSCPPICRHKIKSCEKQAAS